MNELHNLWSSLVDQVREQGLALGTRCGAPTRRTLNYQVRAPEGPHWGPDEPTPAVADQSAFPNACRSG